MVLPQMPRLGRFPRCDPIRPCIACGSAGLNLALSTRKHLSSLTSASNIPGFSRKLIQPLRFQ